MMNLCQSNGVLVANSNDIYHIIIEDNVYELSNDLFEVWKEFAISQYECVGKDNLKDILNEDVINIAFEKLIKLNLIVIDK